MWAGPSDAHAYCRGKVTTFFLDKSEMNFSALYSYNLSLALPKILATPCTVYDRHSHKI